MEEPCDWNVIVQPSSKIDLALSLSSNIEKKKPKSEQTVSKPSKEPQHTHLTTEQIEHRGPARTMKSNSDRNKDKKPPLPEQLHSAENLEPRPALTRKEMQDALPKIPPLPSFKSQVVRPVSFTEAKADFENFMSAGPGRSVEIIRQYGTHEEIHTLADEQHKNNAVSSAGTESTYVKSYRKNEQQDLMDGIAQTQLSKVSASYPVTSRCMSDSSSSSLDSESEMETEQKTDASASSSLSSAPHPKCRPQHIVKSTHVSSTAKQPIKLRQSPFKPHVKAHHPNNLPQAFQYCKPRSVSEEKRAGKNPKVKEGSWRAQRRTQEDEEGDDKEEDNEFSPEEGNGHEQDYWRACYRAWEEFYNSSSASYYHSYYSWLAAYRMNAVYMMEMMKR